MLCYHPKQIGAGHIKMPITAPRTEAVCQQFREEIASRVNVEPAVQFDSSLLNRDHRTFHRILEETWIGLPESTEVRAEPGFFVLCDLCSEYWVFEQLDQEIDKAEASEATTS